MRVTFRKLRKRLSAEKSIRLIGGSKLFDHVFYFCHYPDLVAPGCDPIRHYVSTGAAEEQDPHPLFDTSFYHDKNPDVRNAGLNPLAHFIAFGAAEGRDPHPLFDTGFYQRGNADTGVDSVNPLQHFLSVGAHEGLDPHPCFDSAYYLELNPDVAGQGMNPLIHFVCFGAREQRSPHPLFDTTFYLSQSPQLTSEAENPLTHYLEYGAGEYLNPSPIFDTRYYLEQNQDVSDSGINPLVHYLLFGEKEGRSTRPRRLVNFPGAVTNDNSYPQTRYFSQNETARQAEPSGIVAVKSRESKLPQLSIVITTCNRPQLLAHTIEKCMSFAGGIDLEFIVVDSSSKHSFEHFEALAGKHANLRRLQVPNCRPGHARNIGANIAQHPIILFFNDEVQPVNADFFLAHSDLHARNPEWDIAVLGGVVWNDFTAGPFYRSTPKNEGMQCGLATVMPAVISQRRHSYQCNLSVKKALVADWLNDGFKSDFPAAGLEAVEFVYRKTKQHDRFKICEEPSTVATYNHRSTVQTHIKRQMEAGMMFKVFVDLHPEVVDFFNVKTLIQALQSPAVLHTDMVIADYIAMVEGIKAWARIVGKTEDPDYPQWYDALLAHILELCFHQGFLLAWGQPAANYEKAYAILLDGFKQRVQTLPHHALMEGELLPNISFPSGDLGRKGVTLDATCFTDISRT